MTEEPKLRTAHELLRQGLLTEAEQLIRAQIDGGAELAAAHELLGALYIEQQRPDLAVAAEQAALTLEPGRPSAYRHLARAHQLMGQRQQAVGVLLAAVAQHPHNLRCAVEAALMLRELGETEQLLALIQEVEARLPSSSWELRHLRLEVLLAERRHDEALWLAELLLAEQPDDIGALDALVTANYQAGDLWSAIAAAQQLVAAAPGVAEHGLRAASLLREAGETVRAAEMYQWVADAEGDEPAALAAREALAFLDAAQMPLVLMLAGDSQEFHHALREEPFQALRARGFALSREGLATLLTMLHELPAHRASVRAH